jgi:hypothetical protein
VRGGWCELRNERLCNLYSSPHIIKVIKSRIVRWAGHVVQTGEMNMYIDLEKSIWINHLKDLV